MVKGNLDFECELNGVQFQLRQARSALLYVGMKLQDCGRPEVADALRHYRATEDSVRDLQEMVRELFENFDSNAPVPTENLPSSLPV